MSLEWLFWNKVFFSFFFFFSPSECCTHHSPCFFFGSVLGLVDATKFSVLFFRMLPSSLPKYFTSSTQHFQNRSVFSAASLSGVILHCCLGQACARLSSAQVGCRLQMWSGPDWSHEFDSSLFWKAPVCLLYLQTAALVLQTADDVQRNASHARLCPKARLSWTKCGSHLFLHGQVSNHYPAHSQEIFANANGPLLVLVSVSFLQSEVMMMMVTATDEVKNSRSWCRWCCMFLTSFVFALWNVCV